LLTEVDGTGSTSSSLLKTDTSNSSKALCEVAVDLSFGGAVCAEKVIIIITQWVVVRMSTSKKDATQ
jgi:hypothetical protein